MSDQGHPDAPPPAGAAADATDSGGRSLLWVAGFVLLALGGMAAMFWLPGGADPAVDLRSLTPQQGHQRMIDELRRIAEAAVQRDPYLGSSYADEVAESLESLPATASAVQRCELEFNLGDARARLGELRVAIDHMTRAYELLPKAAVDPATANYVRFKLGVAWLRLGETENCCAANNPDSCIVPIQGGGLHTKVEGSTNAIRYFEEVLRSPAAAPHEIKGGAVNASGRIDTRRASRWLLNLAHMTLGGYPDKVPAQYLIPAETFRSKVEFPRFKNVAKALGLSTFSMCGGAIVDDFDNDGNLDVIASTWEPSGQLRYFRNNADGTFTDRTEAAGLRGLCGGLNMVQADYDNDGHLDFLVLRGAWLDSAGRHPNSLVRNNGDGTFTDVTFRAGLGDVHYPTQTAAWADYDKDGDLDVFIGNEFTRSTPAPSQLFRNNGDGTFTDVAEQAGVQNFGYAKGVTWGDLNVDGFPEVYVSNYMGPNRLFWNKQDGTFVDAAPVLQVTGPIASFPTWFWDYDNDGELDLFVSSYTGRIDELTSYYLGEEARFEMPGLYRSVDRQKLVNMAKEHGVAYPMLPMGSNFGDLDGDGFLDFYLGTGDPDYHNLMPNLMYLNQRGQGFVDVTMAGGFGHLQKGHGIAFADLDNDGDIDVFEQMGGAYIGDKYNDALFENPGFGNNWITIQLVGVRSNRSAIGARIRVEIAEAGKVRNVYRYVNSGGSFGASPLRQTIGLGKATRIQVLEIYWPRTGLAQVFRGVAVNQFLRVVEDNSVAQPLSIKRFKLGG